jgi:ATP-dependent DNA ligase
MQRENPPHRLRWPQLAEEIAHAVRARNAVLDGEICCLASRSRWTKQLQESPLPPRVADFEAFDILSRNGWDLTSVPLLEP